MKVSDLENQIDLVSVIGAKHNLVKTGSVYRVVPCPGCGSKTDFTVYPESNSYSSFKDCFKGGGVYKYLQELEGMSEDQAYKELISLTGNESIKRDPTSQPTKAKDVEPSSKDYTDLIIQSYNNQTDQDKQYFINRGIAPEVIERFKLSVTKPPNSIVKRAMLPTWLDGKVVSYNARAVEEDNIKYLKSKGKHHYFNSDYLKLDRSGEVVFICESEFDALSIESLGHKAMAVGGVSSVKNVKESVERLREKGVIVLTAFDNDEPGQMASEILKDCIPLSIPSEYKDVNEWIVGDAWGFEKSVESHIAKAKRPHNLLDYVNTSFKDDWKQYQEYQSRKTGYSNLDAETSLFPGLYVLGGLSSLGKTTFVHQLADQVAEMGEHVLYFSLEMSRFELISKSLSRGTAKLGSPKKAISSIDIRLNTVCERMEDRELVQKSLVKYADTAKNVSVIEGNFDTTVSSMRLEVDRYARTNGVRPVVIIDYLQIIKADANYSDKQKIDTVVTDLKRMSRDLNIPVIVVSSLNRSNYLTPIDFESFKESGGIEYTADVVLGLQLECLNEDLFNKRDSVKEKRERVNQAKRENPRQIELVCLKNRNGVNYRCKFLYHANCDYFIPDHMDGFEEVKESKKIF